MGDEGYKTNETSEEGSRNTIDFYVEKAIAFGGHNVVDKNKILDMLLSGPRFMGRIPSERNGAVSGNSSSRYLDALTGSLMWLAVCLDYKTTCFLLHFYHELLPP